MLRPTTNMAFGARKAPFPFQADAVLATRNLPYAALFHEQGLGKSKIALDLTLHWLASGVVDSVLVVTKKALVQNWVREVSIHTSMRPIEIGQDRRSNFFAFNRPGRLYISHYEVMHSERGRIRLFARSRRLGVILDESQRIKNPSSLPAKALHALSPFFARRVIMTGTPVANRPYDIWSQIFFLDGGQSLGNSFESFKSESNFRKEFGSDQAAADLFEEQLGKIFEQIRDFTVRETKSSADLSLPNKTIRNTYAEMEFRQSALYEQYRRDLAAEIHKSGSKTLDEADEILKRMLRLVQVASNPRLVDDAYKGTAGKFNALDSIVIRKSPSEPKLIIWTSFVDNVQTIANRYSTLNPSRVHGRLPIPERNVELDRFMEDDDCRVLVATPGAAKEGLTLTVANHAVFFDRNFSLDDYLQAQDRIHRISQTSDCLIENLISIGTIDDWVGELLAAKQLAAALAQGDVSREEYRDQASYTFNSLLETLLNPDPEV